MKIIRTSYRTNSKGLQGYHIVADGSLRHRVSFSQDSKGKYGYFQWGASLEVLGYAVDRTEAICKSYLKGEINGS